MSDFLQLSFHNWLMLTIIMLDTTYVHVHVFNFNNGDGLVTKLFFKDQWCSLVFNSIFTPKEKAFLKLLCSTHYKLLTCSREESAASRYFFPFLVHADDTRFRMAVEEEEPSAEIALWQDVHRAPIANNSASLPCHI